MRLAAATNALRRKKVTEQELERLQNTRFQLEMQVNTLESASFNAENMAAMKKAAGALKDIHGKLYVLLYLNPWSSRSHSAHVPGHSTIDKVDQTMAEIQEQTQLAAEVSEVISSGTYANADFDEVRHALEGASAGRVANRAAARLGRAQGGTGGTGAGRAQRQAHGGSRTRAPSSGGEQGGRQYVLSNGEL